MKNWFFLVLMVALITPCMPKIMVGGDITIYPVEVLLLISFPLTYALIRMDIQKDFLMIWLLILICTIISCFFIPTMGGLLRCVKEIVYIPLMYMAFRCHWLQFKHIAWCFMIAGLLNILYMFVDGLTLKGLSIWNPLLLSSGFSNKYFSLSSMSIEQFNTLSHGIWADYCVLGMCAALLAYYFRQISMPILVTALLLCLLNIGFSVSREGLAVFSFTLVGLLMSVLFKKYRSPIGLGFVLMAVLLIIGCLFYMDEYGDKLPIVQKLQYTQHSYVVKGGESNISIRINTWILFFKSLLEDPVAILFGYGYNSDYFLYQTFLYHRSVGPHTSVPESFVIETFMYGGIICFFYGIKFWFHLFRQAWNIQKSEIRFLIMGFFVGVLFVNTFSGAALVSDLFYGQFLIFLGLLYRYNHQQIHQVNDLQRVLPILAK